MILQKLSCIAMALEEGVLTPPGQVTPGWAGAATVQGRAGATSCNGGLSLDHGSEVGTAAQDHSAQVVSTRGCLVSRGGQCGSSTAWTLMFFSVWDGRDKC